MALGDSAALILTLLTSVLLCRAPETCSRAGTFRRDSVTRFIFRYIWQPGNIVGVSHCPRRDRAGGWGRNRISFGVAEAEEETPFQCSFILSVIRFLRLNPPGSTAP